MLKILFLRLKSGEIRWLDIDFKNISSVLIAINIIGKSKDI